MQKVSTAFLLTLIFFLTFTGNRALAASTTLGVSPQSGSFGKPFSVDLVIDGHGDKFNAAQATVTLSSNLAVQNLVLGDCNFSFLKTPSIQTPSFAGVVLSDSATKCAVYTLTLVPTAKGTGTITITHGSVRRFGDAAEVLSSTQNGSYTLTAAFKAPSVLGTQTTDISKNGLYTVILKILSSQNTPVTSAAVILTPVSAKEHQQATTDTTGTVHFSNLKAGIYDATVEENNTKVEENIINVSGANHVLTLGINIKGEQKNPLLKSANPLFKTPLLIAGILVAGVIVGAVVAFLVSRLNRSKKLK